MSDLEDVMDDYPADASNKAALFDDDDDDELAQRELEDDDAPGPSELEVVAAPTQADRKAMLSQLAARKKREVEGPSDDEDDGEDDGKRRRKKSKGEKKSKSGGAEPHRRSGREGGAAEVGAAEGEEPRARAALADFDNPEDDIETAVDQGFIDDDGAGVDDEQIGSEGVEDEYDDGAPPEEAEEGEEAEEIQFGKNKKKKNKQSEAQMAMVVDDKLAKMEAAAEEDMEQHELGRPAVQKLKMLVEADEFLAQAKYHEMFVSAGGLGVLKAWLEPYSDGSLPNVRVRGSVLRACKALPIDTHREDIKAQLKKSQLGSRVMFLAKCPDESTFNKGVARELVQKWSRPIFYDADMESEKRRTKEELLKVARTQAVLMMREQEAAAEALKAGKPKPKMGQPGYRWRAAMPQTSKLDYVVEPQKDERLMAAAGVREKKETSRFDKKMRSVTLKQKGTTARAAVPSVEGRSIVIMNP